MYVLLGNLIPQEIVQLPRPVRITIYGKLLMAVEGIFTGMLPY